MHRDIKNKTYNFCSYFKKNICFILHLLAKWHRISISITEIAYELLQMLISRTIEQRIKRLHEVFPAIILVGPRQAGKTTVARKIAGETASLMLDLEDPPQRKRLGDDLVAFFRGHSDKLIILDEVQNMPNIFEPLRVAIDDRRRIMRGTRSFLLLGSASGKLLQQTGEALTGRADTIVMSGLNVLETATSTNLQTLWNRGGLPDSLLQPTHELSVNWRNAYIDNTLSWDIAALGGSLDSKNLRKLLELIALSQGSTLKRARVARDLQISLREVDSHIKMLEQMMVIHRLPPFLKNSRRALVKTPKIYLRDSGLFNALRRCYMPTPGRSHQKTLGASWEGFVIENIMSVLPKYWEAYFYGEHSAGEVDLVLRSPSDALWAVEIKWSLASGLTDKGRKAIDGLRPDRAFLVHGGQDWEDIQGTTAIEAMPLSAMMNELLGQEVPAARQHGIRTAHPGGRSHDLAVLLSYILEDDAGLDAQRSQFIDARLARADNIVGEAATSPPGEILHRWRLLREELMLWLGREATAEKEDEPTCAHLDEVRRLLAGMLAKVRQHTELLPGETAGVCAFDLLIHIVAVLLSFGKYRQVHQLLADRYDDGAEPRTSASFNSFGPPEAYSREDAAVIRDYVLPAASLNWGIDNTRLLEAEMMVMLFHLASCLVSTRAIGMPWYPRLSGGRNVGKLPLFASMTRPKGFNILLTCVGPTAAALPPDSLQNAIKQGILGQETTWHYHGPSLLRALEFQRWPFSLDA